VSIAAGTGVEVARGPRFAHRLDCFGDAPALVGPAGALSYADLERRVARRAAELAVQTRRVRVLVLEPTVDSVVEHLASLRAGHVVAPCPPCHVERVSTAYDDAVAGRAELHPDLALLLSTSGSTGSAKLVRLSAENLQSNAAGIAERLGLSHDDRTVTTLALSYSYGLSVVHSALHAGASVLLTDESVASAALARELGRHHVTVLPLVPHSVELVDRSGSGVLEVPTLRLVTSAGGALAPEVARELAERGQRHGWDLAVMYGQTEATARIAILDPALVQQVPDSVGTPLPGTSIRIEDPDPHGVGEIVVRGPGVMLGYAECSADLERGRDVEVLRTGDLGVIGSDGLLRIRGRRSRIAKVMGLRIALPEVETALASQGWRTACAGLPGALGVVVELPGAHADVDASARRATLDGVRRAAAQAAGLGPAVVRVVATESLPRVPAGKIDQDAVHALLEGAGPDETAAATAGDPAERLRLRIESVLAVPVGLDDSFSSLGADSLSHVAVSVVVEEELATLPSGWHAMTVRELARLAGDPADRVPGRGPRDGSGLRGRIGRMPVRTMETAVVLRALAIVLVVGSHAGAFELRGGAHVLLALVGFNLARFHLPVLDLRERARRMARGTATALVPAFVFLIALAALSPTYDWSIVGVTWLVHGDDPEAPEWRMWFLQSLLWVLPVLIVMLRLPWVEAVRRRIPYLLPLLLVLVLVIPAYPLLAPNSPRGLFHPSAIAWVVVLGWLVAESRTTRTRITTSVLVVALGVLAFDETRAWVIPACVVALVWLPTVRVPRRAVPWVAAVAAASLWTYLTHWVVLDHLGGWLALGLSLVLGYVAMLVVDRVRHASTNRLTAALHRVHR
jgi:acyl-CoA synthetase (AMP-forming)/AMP-acid ligase II